MKSRAFTIVELLIVIVVIAVLASISVVAYNGAQSRAVKAKTDSDMTTLYKAIIAAREGKGAHLRGVTGSVYTIGYCIHPNWNAAGEEPSQMEKSHPCWTENAKALDYISQASGMNLESLKAGDVNGNPYSFDENEGESACPAKDALYTFNGSGNSSYTLYKTIPRFDGCS